MSIPVALEIMQVCTMAYAWVPVCMVYDYNESCLPWDKTHCDRPKKIRRVTCPFPENCDESYNPFLKHPTDDEKEEDTTFTIHNEREN